MHPAREVFLASSVYSETAIADAQTEFSASCEFAGERASDGLILGIRVRPGSASQAIDEFLSFALRASLVARCHKPATYR
jgi:hypothetical protein